MNLLSKFEDHWTTTTKVISNCFFYDMTPGFRLCPIFLAKIAKNRSHRLLFFSTLLRSYLVSGLINYKKRPLNFYRHFTIFPMGIVSNRLEQL